MISFSGLIKHLSHISRFGFDSYFRKTGSLPEPISFTVLFIKYVTVNYNHIFFNLERAFAHSPVGKSILSLKLVSTYVLTDCVITGSKTLSSLLHLGDKDPYPLGSLVDFSMELVLISILHHPY
jgi:hypothetical protein